MGGGCHSTLLHVVGAQESDKTVVGFGRFSQIVRYQFIGWVKHLAKAGGKRERCIK